MRLHVVARSIRLGQSEWIGCTIDMPAHATDTTLGGRVAYPSGRSERLPSAEVWVGLRFHTRLTARITAPWYCTRGPCRVQTPSYAVRSVVDVQHGLSTGVVEESAHGL